MEIESDDAHAAQNPHAEDTTNEIQNTEVRGIALKIEEEATDHREKVLLMAVERAIVHHRHNQYCSKGIKGHYRRKPHPSKRIRTRLVL
jgi:hypothetical protein